jgi:hypothetical protein
VSATERSLFFRLAPFAALGLALGGCEQILGVDAYSIGHGGGAAPLVVCSATAGADGGSDCVGVTSCANGTVPDTKGGCTAILPPAACDPSTCNSGAPCIGSPEQLGQQSCTSTQNTWFSCPAPGASPRIPLGVDPSAVRYVNPSFTGQSDGTADKPWTTIAAALADVPPNGAVLVAAGAYAEDLVIEKPGIRLVGACPDQVVIRGSGAPAPAGYPCATHRDSASGASSEPVAAICIASSAAGSSVQAVDVTGAAEGIAVIGATGVTIEAVEVSQTERYGIRIEELGRPDGTLAAASASLAAVSVRGARGAGIYVAGATLDNRQGFVNVSGTRPLNEYLGYGVSVRPGAVVLSALESLKRTRGNVSLSGAVLVGNADAALLVSGSTATVTDSYLGNLTGVDPVGRGVLVERETAGSEEPADVTLTRTVIERTRDAAIDARSARVTLEDTTIRNTFGRSGDGCSGQGIRLRADRLAPASATVRHSLIDGSRQAAIHSLGGTVTVDRSILRGSAPGDAAATCAPHLGDGVTLEPLPPPGDAPALTLDHALVDGNRRAAVAAFGGTVAATGTLLTCNGHGLVARGDLPGARTGLTCGCGHDLAACDVENAALEPWMSPGKGSGHIATETWVMPVQNAYTLTKLTNGVAFLLDVPEVAPAFPDGKGCATLAGVPKDLPADLRRLAVWAEGGYSPGVWQVPPGVTPDCSSLLGTGSTQQAAQFITGEPIDVNRAFVFAGGPPSSNELQQSPESGAPWLPVVGSWIRYNTDPGWLTITRTDDVVCSGNPGSGELVPNADRSIRVLAEPGMIINAIGNGCYAPGPCGNGFPDPAHAGQCLTGAEADTACNVAENALPSSGETGYGPCAACSCRNCMSPVSTCLGDASCTTFLRCVVRTHCNLSTCLVACASEFAALGSGMGATAGAVGDCLQANCAGPCFGADGG